MVAAQEAEEHIVASHNKVEAVAAHGKVEPVEAAHDKVEAIGATRSGKCTFFTAAANS